MKPSSWQIHSDAMQCVCATAGPSPVFIHECVCVSWLPWKKSVHVWIYRCVTCLDIPRRRGDKLPFPLSSSSLLLINQSLLSLLLHPIKSLLLPCFKLPSSLLLCHLFTTPSPLFFLPFSPQTSTLFRSGAKIPSCTFLPAAVSHT